MSCSFLLVTLLNIAHLQWILFGAQDGCRRRCNANTYEQGYRTERNSEELRRYMRLNEVCEIMINKLKVHLTPQHDSSILEIVCTSLLGFFFYNSKFVLDIHIQLASIKLWE